MGLPLYDLAARTSNVTSGGALIAVAPAAVAAGSSATARVMRLRQVAVSNTTATGFGVGIGIASAAGATPTSLLTSIVRRGGTGDATSTASAAATAWGTTPTAPTAYSARLWVPGNSLVVWVFGDGEELLATPAATALPFGVWNTGTGQIADVTVSWEE